MLSMRYLRVTVNGLLQLLALRLLLDTAYFSPLLTFAYWILENQLTARNAPEAQ